MGILAVESSLRPVPRLITHRQRLTALSVVCSPPHVNPPTARLHRSLPSISGHRVPDSSSALTRGLKSVYLPLNWKTPRPVPPIMNHLPVDSIANRTICFTHGLSKMPMINSHLFAPALALATPSLMDNAYSTLKKRVREALLNEWASLFPTPGYYLHPSALNPQPFMGLSKFMAGRIHQRRAGKSYLAAHPTGRLLDADRSCHCCSLEPETFDHAILSCPSRQNDRSSVLQGVTHSGHKTPLWTALPLLQSIATLNSMGPTGFPPEMFPPGMPPSSAPLYLSPLTVPPPVFRVFSLAQVSVVWVFLSSSFWGPSLPVTTRLLVCAFLFYVANSPA